MMLGLSGGNIHKGPARKALYDSRDEQRCTHRTSAKDCIENQKEDIENMLWKYRS